MRLDAPPSPIRHRSRRKALPPRDPPNVQRRAKDGKDRWFIPARIGGMLKDGLHFVDATCTSCRHTARVDVSEMDPLTYVPDVGLYLRCSACGAGGEYVMTEPRWHDNPVHKLR